MMAAIEDRSSSSSDSTGRGPVDNRFVSAPVVSSSGHVARSLAAVRSRIASVGRDPESVLIVAMSKGFGALAIRAAVAAGLDTFGENFADELVQKASELSDVPGLKWHFTGALQTNKLNRLVPVVDCWQTLDSVGHAQALASRSSGAKVFIQVKLAAAAGRSGCSPDETFALVRECVALGLDVRGLMGIGPDPATLPDGRLSSRAAFAVLRSLRDRCGVPELSMGMSGDLEDAVAEGATIVRIGTALFGNRPSEEFTQSETTSDRTTLGESSRGGS